MDNKRLDNAVHDAELEFWASIAESYPEATTGDLSPLTAMALQMKMENAVEEWLQLNVNDR